MRRLVRLVPQHIITLGTNGSRPMEISPSPHVAGSGGIVEDSCLCILSILSRHN
jgi:hypothetical protein